VDIAPIQVEIEARILDVNRANELTAGINWGPSSNISIGEDAPRAGFRFGRFSRVPLQIPGSLNYQEILGRSKTLANPRISVIDNEEASIFIGEVRRFPVTALASTAANQTFVVEVEEVPVGIALLVRPRVNNETGEITMNIKPAVSTVTSLVQGIPQTATREASTTLRARDGETIVIGGLISDQESKSLQQVPILGQIPIIGELFRNRTNRRTRSEIVLFLTPRLLRDNGAAGAAALEQRVPGDLKPQPIIPRGTARP
jgi:type II secretory pathway component GspD/PulD (secretin)